jgi:hypothetical protein
VRKSAPLYFRTPDNVPFDHAARSLYQYGKADNQQIENFAEKIRSAKK